MATLTELQAQLQTGDLIITEVNPMAAVHHTTVFLEPKDSPTQRASFVHAGDTTEVRDFDAYKDVCVAPYIHISIPNPGLKQALAKQACAWAAKASPYGASPTSLKDGIPGKANASRYYGMVATDLKDIPFDSAALLRLIKWTKKALRNEPLSKNRGITCCAFVLASAQTACMRKFLEIKYIQPDVLYAAYNELVKMFETKEAVHARTGLQLLITEKKTASREIGDKVGYVNQALRENSNRSTLAGTPNDVEELWQLIQSKLLKISAPEKLAKLLPPEIFYDVKYMNTKQFVKSVTWKKTQPIEKFE